MNRNPNISDADYARADDVNLQDRSTAWNVAMVAADAAEQVSITKFWEQATMTCSEAEAFASLLRVTGYEDAAATLIRSHAVDDDDPGDLHYRGGGS